ncbi:DUF397 domain-containing protein [Streptomyces sp. NPDC059740]|uniref:DUF397 domain-containing protein n=1 Tax=Streptomyces sp. NPDC059740 TaxID=3346926 RepID=UPI00365D1864
MAQQIPGYRNDNAPERTWFKSTFSDLDYSKDCVALAEFEDGSVGITDSKDTGAAVLRMTRSEIAAFVQGARRGDFDRFC